MSNVNSVTVSGNLTRDLEVKWESSDGESIIVAGGLAVNRSRKDKDSGEYVDEASFFDFSVFGGFAKLCLKKMAKGDHVTIQGRLEQQRWETPEGENRSKVVIIATQIDGACFFKPASENNDVPEGPAATPATEAAPAAAPAEDDIPF